MIDLEKEYLKIVSLAVDKGLYAFGILKRDAILVETVCIERFLGV